LTDRRRLDGCISRAATLSPIEAAMAMAKRASHMGDLRIGCDRILAEQDGKRPNHAPVPPSGGKFFGAPSTLDVASAVQARVDILRYVRSRARWVEPRQAAG